jgi:2,4-dienoyl-CoA reductase-like NADH-dependent reductase (Old Yellow Enzyme family)
MDANLANPHSTRGENERKVFQRDRRPHLFRPIDFRSVRVRNRITLSQMCQYSAENGVPGDWHFQHLYSRAVGGAGIVFTESVAIEPRGLITPHCLGLWNDEQRDAYARIAHCVSAAGAVPAIQLNHAGRKGAVGRPWEGGKPLTKDHGAWPLIAPSALAFGDGYQVPAAMDVDAIAKTIGLYAVAARRARGGFPNHRSARGTRLSRA